MEVEREETSQDPFLIHFVVDDDFNKIAEIRDNPDYEDKEKLRSETFNDLVLYAGLRSLSAKGYILGDPQLFCSDPGSVSGPDRILVRVTGGLVS